MVRTRGEAAGLRGLHPHAFRHAWAHANLAHGMQEGEVMMLAGCYVVIFVAAPMVKIR